ncbi:hypothetical protein ANN_09546 [Periplaneta americana]|uniref:Uncharacterized protein n=1 Tax=Periplaneta americana TaxID=6978 RepID=A0ABQ8TLY3_PERAM|nr:hypothetical protein ANN_09546 [Periplaneta americana]
MAGLYEGGNEPPGSLKASQVFPGVSTEAFLAVQITSDAPRWNGAVREAERRCDLGTAWPHFGTWSHQLLNEARLEKRRELLNSQKFLAQTSYSTNERTAEASFTVTYRVTQAGENANICNAADKIRAFKRKLQFWMRSLAGREFESFPAFKDFLEENEGTLRELDEINEEFVKHLEDMHRENKKINTQFVEKTVTSCLSEIETLGYVLGACPYGETLRIHRHHAIRTKLADALRKLKYTVYEVVHGTADNGSNRRIDIIAISESLFQGMIIDPTIRFETYEGQPEDVHEEKRAIYVPNIPYYKDTRKYQLHDISITGLMFGARGTIPNFSSQFCYYERKKKTVSSAYIAMCDGCKHGMSYVKILKRSGDSIDPWVPRLKLDEALI